MSCALMHEFLRSSLGKTDPKGVRRQPGMVIPSPGAEILRDAGALWMPQGRRMSRASTGPDDDSAHRKDHLRRIVGHNEENFPKQSVLSTTCLSPSAPAPARE